MASIAVIGGGAWGTALACHAARHDHAVRLWAREPEVARAVEEQHENTVYLPRVPLPASLRGTNDMAEALDGAELVIFVPPAQHLRATATTARPHLPSTATIAVASKGLEERSLMLLRDVLRDVLPEAGDERVSFLSGPSFAREVAKGLPTDVVVASAKKTAALHAQSLLHSPLFRVYTSEDVVGVEVGGAVKNVIAIAAGACDGLKFGDNARAALVTRGLAEITRLGVRLGADPLTFLGMAGAGDLFLTCGGGLSRNRTLGLKVAAGIDPREWVRSQTSVAEGFYTAAAARDLSRKLDVDMPITAAVYSVLHEGVPLLEAIRGLLTRDFKDEQLGLR